MVRRIDRIGVIILGLLLLFTLLHPHPSQAHNGAVAIAVPVEGITIDGDLSDWPEDMRRYPTILPESGVRPKDLNDFQGSFRIGYNDQENALYIAVEVQDESVVIDTTATWDTQDGCEIYVDVEHKEQDFPAEQYVVYGTHRRAGRHEVEVKRTGRQHRYEWRIDMGKMTGKIVLGVDVVVCDKDEDASFSWMAWGRGMFKSESSDRRGDVVLIKKATGTGKIQGKIKWEDREEGAALGKVRIRSLMSTETWIQTTPDLHGEYEIALPPGKYRVEAGYGHRKEGGYVAQVQANRTVRVNEIFFPRPPLGKKIKAGTGRSIAAGAGYRHGFWHTLGVPDGLPDNSVRSLLEDREGQLWIGTEGGVSRYDGERFVTYTTQDGLPNNRVVSLLEDQEGQLWIGTEGGVSRYDGERFVTYTTQDGLPNNRVVSLLEDREGQLWIGTEGGVSRYDGERFVTYTTQDGLPNNYVVSLLEDREGQLWIGTTDGASRYDGERFVTYTTQDGLPNNYVVSLLEDREGQLWIGTTGGVSRYDGERFVTYTTQDGLPDNGVWSLLEDQEGQLWIGTDRGVSRYDGERFVTYTTQDGLSNNWVRSLLEDRTGQLWIGTDKGGVSRYDGERFVTYTTQDGLPDNSVWSLLEDREGQLWIGTASGVSRYDGERYVTYTTQNGLSNNWGRSLLEDRTGQLWIGTMGGVSRYDGEYFVIYTTQDGLTSNWVVALLEDRTGQLWIGTWGGGVNRYDGMRYVTYTTTNGLPDNRVWSLLEDQEGQLWIGTAGGVSRWDGFVSQNLLRQDGLPSNDVRSILQDRQGDIWLATSEGLVRYRPPRTPPPIHIRNVIADRDYRPVKEIRVPSSQKRITFEFLGISYRTRANQIAYVYRLEGHDADWRQTRERRVTYTDLPQGEYVFQVKAVDRDLNYSEEPATVDIEVYHQPVSSSIRISELNIQDVFASFYKTYVEQSIGSVLVTNDDSTPIEATLNFYIPDHMRRPTEQTLLLEPQSSRVIPLHAILQEEILDLEGAIPAHAEVALSCELGEQTFSIKESKNITLYGRGALTWDDLGRAAAFITPEDHSISAFSRSLFEEYRFRVKRRDVDGHIPTAMLFFEALNAYGIKYAQDASTPYSQVRGDRSAVDNIQYPVELLQSRMGDCDDCTVLYCALLENLNIPTALVDAPDHILMMFDSGVSEERYFGFSLDEDRYIEREGRFWIPVEITQLGEGSFMEAWELGAKTCQRLREADALSVTDVRQVWPEYPYALPAIEEKIIPPDSEELERSVVAGMEQLKKMRSEYVRGKYIEPLLQNPGDHPRRMELARTRIESGDFNEAIVTLMNLLETDLKAEAYYLIGYSYAGQQNIATAVRYVEKALEHDPENRGYRYSLEGLKRELMK